MSLLEQLVGEIAPALREELGAIVRTEMTAALAASMPAGEPWRLLTLAEACERLGRSERQVRAWAKSGELPTVRLDGGALGFDVDDLRAFALSRRVSAEALEPLAGRWQPRREPRRGAGPRVARPASDRRVADA